MSNFFKKIQQEEKHCFFESKRDFVIATSYWANARNITNMTPVSFLTKMPSWSSKANKVEVIKELSPTTRVIERLSNKNEAGELYLNNTLNRLNPLTILEKLNGKVLMGWVSPEGDCLRGVVADWIERETGIVIVEYGTKEKQSDIKGQIQETLF